LAPFFGGSLSIKNQELVSKNIMLKKYNENFNENKNKYSNEYYYDKK